MRPLISAVATLSLLLVACSTDQPTGIIRDPAPVVGHLALPDASGDTTHFVGEEGGLLLVYFGYTTCPDVCPTTMADVRSALAQIGEKAGRVSVAMVTIDPEHDTVSEVDNYVKVFFDSGIGLRTDDDTLLREVAGVFGADYLVETSEAGDTLVSHTAFLYAVDSDGTIRMQWPFGATPDDMAHDFDLLLDSL